MEEKKAFLQRAAGVVVRLHTLPGAEVCKHFDKGPSQSRKYFYGKRNTLQVRDLVQGFFVSGSNTSTVFIWVKFLSLV